MHITLKKPLVYVTRDIERALGMEPGAHGDAGYFIVSNDTAYGREIKVKFPENVLLVKTAMATGGLDTFDLLVLPEVQSFIETRSADLLVFQNTPRIERLAEQKGWNLLNPRAEIAKIVEEKISQIEWLGDDASLLPPYKVAPLKELKYEGSKFVLQFNHSHTGQGTFIISSKEELAVLSTKFPDRECRVSRFIEGPVFTVNAVVGDDEPVIVGNPSYQITGLEPFTDVPLSTIGNDWSLARKDEYEGAYDQMRAIALRVGVRLKESDWHGLFGIDLIYDAKAAKVFLLEINARQAASAVFESTLQKYISPDSSTLFEAHISAVSGSPLAPNTYLSTPISGAQIVKRVTAKTYSVDLLTLRNRGLTVISYENTAANKELVRIQSTEGIMEGHNRLNELGNFIKTCIS